ncbi:flagellar hook-associated protein FlgK [Photobacterium ganghwense]|uniref:flagellar hook-associated protein FlgK n=1 Tax=Photobacterium ganghwense TaxID=320778 RepID=UPI001C2DC1D1|nr:flagellar hook-associated protein FlgK [Photobacterium ganghwense]MBV1840476.1 flagellar hook-associated protein FlgK [Photobacterium ganghwense]
MALDLLQIGVSGLRSSQKQLNVTGHNINNVNTPGYSRQLAEQKANDAVWLGGDYYGSGSYIDNVSRAYDRFAARELTLTTTQLHASNEKASQLAIMDDYISRNASKTVSNMNDYYDAVKSLADHPNDMGSRKAVIENAGLVASTLNSAHGNLTDMHREVSDQVAASVSRVNTLGQELAALNARVLESQGGEKNDLYDQQQQLINELAEYTNVTVLSDKENPAQTIMIGQGYTLVSGVEPSKLTIVPGEPDPSQSQVALEHGNSLKPLKAESMGGKIGALIEYRSDVIEKGMNEVGRMAIGFASEINTMQRQGLDLEGQPGQNLFTDVNSLSAQQQRVITEVGSTADIKVAIDDVKQLKADEYRLETEADPVTGALTYSLFNSADELVTQAAGSGVAGQQIAVDGMVIEIGTPPVEGESVQIRPVRQGAGEISLNTNDPKAIAAQRVVTETETNTGNAHLEALPGATATGRYQVQLSAAGDSVSVTDANGNALTLTDSLGNSGTALGYPLQDGLFQLTDASGSATLRLTRSGQANDSFVVELGAKPAEGDNSNLMAMQSLQTEKSMNGGRSSIIDLFEGLSTDVGIQKQNAEKMTQINQMDFDAATERVQSLSGVNLDEEAANLMKFQQAYMASSRIMSVAKETFDTLMRAI